MPCIRVFFLPWPLFFRTRQFSFNRSGLGPIGAQIPAPPGPESNPSPPPLPALDGPLMASTIITAIPSSTSSTGSAPHSHRASFSSRGALATTTTTTTTATTTTSIPAGHRDRDSANPLVEPGKSAVNTNTNPHLGASASMHPPSIVPSSQQSHHSSQQSFSMSQPSSSQPGGVASSLYRQYGDSLGRHANNDHVMPIYSVSSASPIPAIHCARLWLPSDANVVFILP